MFSYYGSKSKIAHCYPVPVHNKIIEPFAGSARYSLKYFENEILLIDKSPQIIEIWNYLKECSIKDILSLPSLPAYHKIKPEDFDCAGQYNLMRYIIVQGASSGNNVVSSWGSKKMDSAKKNIAKSLFKIKHWEIKLGEYFDSPDIKATWFIDPPYQFGGHKYPMSNKKINYIHLKEWIELRAGQTIVCENTKATWASFKPMISQKGSMFRTTEAIWSNMNTAYDNIQQSLFVQPELIK